MFDPHHPGRGWALTWPRELFRRELQQLLMGPQFFAVQDLTNAVELLFAEAMRGPDPLEDLQAVRQRVQTLTDTAWGAGFAELPVMNHVRKLAQTVLDHVDELPTFEPKSYYRDRDLGTVAPDDPRGWSENERVDRAMRAWGHLIRELDGAGYFDRRGGENCSDDDSALEHPLKLSSLVAEHCGLTITWPPELSNDTSTAEYDFYTLVEVLHDLVDRPRTRGWHDFDGHYFFNNFSEQTGQAIYRWKVTNLLAKHMIGYRLADEGEDTGLLVSTLQDPRAELEHAVRHEVPDTNLSRIDHAIALFRRRGASVEDKRSACKALADVLENRRPLLKEQLRSKDEGALFQIANEFAIRHHDGKQHVDYAQEEFLDWVFWSYLATIELSNRLMARSPTAMKQVEDA